MYMFGGGLTFSHTDYQLNVAGLVAATGEHSEPKHFILRNCTAILAGVQLVVLLADPACGCQCDTNVCAAGMKDSNSHICFQLITK